MYDLGNRKVRLYSVGCPVVTLSIKGNGNWRTGQSNKHPTSVSSASRRAHDFTVTIATVFVAIAIVTVTSATARGPAISNFIAMLMAPKTL